MSRKRAVRPTLDRVTWTKVFSQADTRFPTGRRDRAMYWLAYLTGMRVGELVNLRVKDVNLKRGVLTTPPEGKSGQRKLGIPDSKQLDEYLHRWLDVRNKVWNVESDYFFCTQSGSKISEGNFYNTFVARCKKAGVEGNPSPHWMRHSYATERIHEGVDVLDLMSELGHRNVETTMVYLHQENRRAIENMRQRAV